MSPIESSKVLKYSNQSAEVTSVSVKYIFLDIVKFTQGRSVEAQSDIVKTLNKIVNSAVKAFEVSDENLIYLPTGDGICISLLYIEIPYDIHIRIALDILNKIYTYNQNIKDPMRQFEVRIGINANVDNVIIDINQNRNIAGSGVNTAQRVMSIADGGQILVGQTVFETLRFREKYMNAFKRYETAVKHNEKLIVYQYIEDGHEGLNIGIPYQFEEESHLGNKRLTKLAAYYFLHSMYNRKFFSKKLNTTDAVIGTVLLWCLATDSVSESEATDIKPPTLITWKAGKASFEEQFEYYSSIDMRINWSLFRLIVQYELQSYEKYFERNASIDWRFITQEGKEKLKREFPNILKQFDLG